MAGTIFGLPLSQRVDINGLPSVGWLLYLYQANTSTPVNSYQDTALTVLNPWPLPADSFGMMPQFWLADGNYRARATNADGSITYFDQVSILALGASSGAAPSGGVDPNAIFQTGDVMWLDRQGTRSGWVRDNARTIGSATSGGSERANSDCQALFEFLWNNFDNTRCPVVTGRGASSLADWTANKQITTPDRRGTGMIGLDDMGNAAASRFTAAVPFPVGNATTAASIAGANDHTLSAPQMPAHAHTGGGTTSGQSNDHTHGYDQWSSPQAKPASGGTSPPVTLTTGQTGGASQDHTHDFGFTTDPTGGGSAHNNTQRSALGTYYRKL